MVKSNAAMSQSCGNILPKKKEKKSMICMCTLTPKTESMFHSVSFHALYFENEWANYKWVNTRVVVSKVYYNHKKTGSKKQLWFGSKWISKLTTRIDSVVWLVFIITKFFGIASFLAKMTSIFYKMLLYII
jgi:hypothetical protein